MTGECNRPDDPNDEDQLDFAVVSTCPSGGALVEQDVCLTSALRSAGISIHTAAIYDMLDSEGNGNGILDGDNGNKIVSLHNSLLDALSGINPISGKIVFGNGVLSNGQILPNGDLQVNVNQQISIFGRLVSLDECVAISVVTYHFSSQPEIVTQPRSVSALIDEENVCMAALIQNYAGIPYTVQWQERINGVFVDIPGANSNNFCIDTAKIEYNQRVFRLLTYSTEDVDKTCVNTSGEAYLSIGGDPKLACIDFVNISLDGNCQALITPEMINKGTNVGFRFRIRITDAQGHDVPNPVTGDYIGQTLTVYVIDRLNGNSCWSLIYIEDKLPPMIDCPLDYTVSCANTGFVPPYPYFQDACDAGATIALISSELTEYACGRPDRIIAKKVFTFVAKDKYGNTSRPCLVNVYFIRSNVNNIQWPENLNLSCSEPSSYPIWDVNKNHYPDVSETGAPKAEGLNLADFTDGKLLSNTLCHINLSYTDEEIALCGNSFRVIRTWILLDWCNQDVKYYTQFIVVKDNEAPEIVCPSGGSIKIFTDDYTCTGTLLVSAPTIVRDCNETRWYVSYSVYSNTTGSPEEQIYITDNVVFNGRDYYIVDVPQGKTWIRYTVLDACDNQSICYVEVEVIDNIKPVPVCDEHTVIGLTENGIARLFAKTLDDGSHDNCSDVRFGIRRMNNSCGTASDAVLISSYLGNRYYSFVDFCCTDVVNNSEQVELLVIDAAGNMNTCMTWVEIQNKSLPKLVCPPNVTLDCDAPFTPADLNSFATYTAGCPLYFLDFEDRITNLNCGEKNINRTWRVRENTGGKVVILCVQHIFIRNLTPFDLNSVVFPEHKTLVNQCNGVNDFSPKNPLTGGYPTWTTIGCSQVAASYRDEIFENDGDACFKILRHWTVIDWCTHKPDDASTEKYRQQVIKVIDTERPIAKCKDERFEITEGCTRLVTLIGDSEDSCTPADEMIYKHSLDGEPYKNSRLFNRNLASGVHTLTWIVEDKCGNKDTCSQVITVVDGKKPTPYCITVLSTVLMPSSSKVELRAKDYDHGATDNCSKRLRFTFGANTPINFNNRHYYKSVNGRSVSTTETEYLSGKAELWDPVLNTSSRVFTCDDIGLNELNVYVWDDAGNNDFCTVKIIIQDNAGICSHSGSVIADGVITAVNGTPMESVETYIINDLNREEDAAIVTDDTGLYFYDRMLNKVNYVVEPHKSDDYLNGVTTIDLVLIQRHILGLEEIKEPGLLLAADVNHDGKITASDLSEIRKLILGVTTELPDKKSWIFVMPQGQLEDPWLWPQSVSITAQNNTRFTNNFTGIKRGDVNMSADVSGINAGTESRHEPATILLNKGIVKAGTDASLSFKAGNFEALTSIQLSLEINKDAQIVNIVSGLLDMKQEHYHIADIDGRQVLNISWNQSTSIEIPDNGILFDVIVRTDEDMATENIMKINDNIPAELSDEVLNSYSVRLRVADELAIKEQTFMVYQNVPNPFTQSTMVRYYIRENEQVDIRITDIDGKVIYRTQSDGESGYNELQLNKDIFNNKHGMYLLTLSTTHDTGTIKMLITE